MRKRAEGASFSGILEGFVCLQEPGRQEGMLSRDQTMDILLLHKQGQSIRRIARHTGHSRNTVRRAVREGAPRPFQTPTRSSKLDPFKDYLRQRFQEHGLSGVRLTQEIRKMGFEGSERIVCRFLATLRVRRPSHLTVRFETPPGEQAQADWAEAGRYHLPDGSSVRVFFFVMVLGFSRALYIEFTRSMRLESMIRCHQNAFAYFGGWPARILYDNMRQVIVRPGLINPRFRDFADHHGFEPKAHRPYRPRTKGKVERMVSYVKDNFLAGRSFESLEDLNTQGRHWLDTVANVRIHATTGARPFDLLEKERPSLTPLGVVAPYQIIHSVQRTVDAEALVRFENVRYSVPAFHAGARVAIEAFGGSIRIRTGNLILAEHPRCLTRDARVEDPAHVKERRDLSMPAAQAPPQRAPLLAFTHEVEVQARPLSFYQEVL
jgi:transposase